MPVKKGGRAHENRRYNRLFLHMAHKHVHIFNYRIGNGAFTSGLVSFQFHPPFFDYQIRRDQRLMKTTIKTQCFLAAILFCSIGTGCFSKSSDVSTSSGSGMSFYGFTLGESKGQAINNMRARQLDYFDYSTYRDEIYKERGLTGNRPDTCHDEAKVTGILLIVCFLSNSDAKATILAFLDDVLVTIRVTIDPSAKDGAYQQIRNKYGSKEVEWSEEKTKKQKEDFKDPAIGELSPFTSPFGMSDIKGESCGTCKITEFPRETENERVYLVRNNGRPTDLTLTNIDLVQMNFKKVIKLMTQEHAFEKQRVSF